MEKQNQLANVDLSYSYKVINIIIGTLMTLSNPNYLKDPISKYH